MRPEFVNPSMELSKLVVRYLSARNNGNVDCCKSQIIPRSYLSLVFNLSKSRSILSLNGNIRLPEYCILSPTISHGLISDTPFELLIVLCRVSAFREIFKIAPKCFSNKDFLVCDLFDGYPMLKTLKEISNPRERIAFFEHFILNNTALRSYKAIKTDEFRSDLFVRPKFHEFTK